MCSSFDVVEKVRVPDAEMQQVVLEQVERRATSPVRVPEGTAVPVQRVFQTVLSENRSQVSHGIAAQTFGYLDLKTGLKNPKKPKKNPKKTTRCHHVFPLYCCCYCARSGDRNIHTYDRVVLINR